MNEISASRTGTSISTIAKTAGLSRQEIYRLKDNPAWAEGVLATWAAWRSVGGLAFVCSTSPVRRSTPRALRHLRRLRAVRTQNDA